MQTLSDGSVQEWCRKFKEGRTDVHDEGGHGRKSVATVGLVERVDQVVRKVQLGSFRTNFRMPSRRISPRWRLTSLQKASRSLCHDMTNASTVLAIM